MVPNTNPELTTIATLAGDQARRPVKAGDVIFRSGESGEKLYGVLSGEVHLSWEGDRHETFGAGTCFGVGALVDPEHRRFGTATVTTDGELVEMNREQFLFALQELPMFALEMLHDLENRLRDLKHADAAHGAL
jgi:CRP/FNR family cyclic AMP-dependent transcriptional regulator